MFIGIRKLILLLPLFFLFIEMQEVTGQQVPPLQVMNYLKEKIQVFYVPQPNRAVSGSARIYQISTNDINSNTNGVIFGRGGNNGMSTCARLLRSIFKSREGVGNGSLQDWLYQIIKIKDKPVKIYFYNDVNEPLTEIAVFAFNVDTLSRDGGARIWPATWGSNETDNGGSIDLGEKYFENNLPGLQNVLLELFTSIALNSTRPLHPSGCQWIDHPDLNTRFYMYASVMDRRFITDQGISAAIINTYDTALQRKMYNWFLRPSLMVTRVIRPGTFLGENRQYWLQEANSFPGLFGALKNFPENDEIADPIVRQLFGWFNFSDSSSRAEDVMNYKIRNEISQALLYNAVMRLNSLGSFLEAIKQTNQQYRFGTSRSKFVIMLEQICRVEMNNLTPAQLAANPPENKKYLLPMVIIDFLSGRDPDFSFMRFTKYVGEGFPREIFDLYTQDIRTAIRAITYSLDDPDAWYSIRNQIKNILVPE